MTATVHSHTEAWAIVTSYSPATGVVCQGQQFATLAGVINDPAPCQYGDFGGSPLNLPPTDTPPPATLTATQGSYTSKLAVSQTPTTLTMRPGGKRRC